MWGYNIDYVSNIHVILFMFAVNEMGNLGVYWMHCYIIFYKDDDEI